MIVNTGLPSFVNVGSSGGNVSNIPTGTPTSSNTMAYQSPLQLAYVP